MNNKININFPFYGDMAISTYLYMSSGNDMNDPEKGRILREQSIGVKLATPEPQTKFLIKDSSLYRNKENLSHADICNCSRAKSPRYKKHREDKKYGADRAGAHRKILSPAVSVNERRRNMMMKRQKECLLVSPEEGGSNIGDKEEERDICEPVDKDCNGETTV